MKFGPALRIIPRTKEIMLVRVINARRLAGASIRFASSAPTPRAELRKTLEFKEGDVIHGFRVQRLEPVPDFSATAVLLNHEKTGAQYLHVDTPDTNNTFSITFRTPPKNNRGVPHILEHTTLCGSKKYPVRDPFFNMLKRSLSTYMNAWTTPDHTMYPFITTHPTDYKNLLRVYLDAVLNPLLSLQDFRQEGHRLEYSDPLDAKSPLTIKGVVYNEMKGVYSDMGNIFATRLQELLHRGASVANNSGGEPAEIPDLSYDELKEFHTTRYHPSNALIFSYGDMPLEDTLKIVNEEGVGKFTFKRIQSDISPAHRLLKPEVHQIKASPDPMAADPQKQAKVAVGWVTPKTVDPMETVKMSLLFSLLASGPQSPIYQALIDSQLASGYAPMTGYESSFIDGQIVLGASNVSNTDWEKIPEVIMQTLEKAAVEGFPQERVEAMLHQQELALKHKSTTFGLGLASSLMPHWVHGASPLPRMQVTKLVSQLREEMAKNPQLFQSLIKSRLLENKHRITLVMTPDEKFSEQLAEQEKQRIATIASTITPQMSEEIIAQAVDLKRRQEQPQNVSVLPKMYTADIPRVKQYEVVDTSDPTFFKCPAATNGVVYFRLLANLKDLPDHLQMYVPLYCQVLGQMNTGKHTYGQLSQEFEMKTGGLSFSPQVNPDPEDASVCTQNIAVSSYALERNTEHMLGLFAEVFSGTQFGDEGRLANLVQQAAADSYEAIVSSGQAYASGFASSSFLRTTALGEQWSGLTQLSFMQQLAGGENVAEAIAALKSISALLQSNVLRTLVVSDPAFMPKAVSSVERTLGSYPRSAFSKNELLSNTSPALSSSATKFHFPVESQVNYVAHAMKTGIPITHPDYPRLKVLAQLLRNEYLHREVREKGGAYGSGASVGSASFTMSSYRDPFVNKTLDTFQNAVQWTLKNDSFKDEDLEQAKLSLFQSIDAPISPIQHGTSLFLQRVTNQMRQDYRQRVLDTSRDDLAEVAQRYLANPKQSASAVIGGEAGMGDGWRSIELSELYRRSEA